MSSMVLSLLRISIRCGTVVMLGARSASIPGTGTDRPESTSPKTKSLTELALAYAKPKMACANVGKVTRRREAQLSREERLLFRTLSLVFASLDTTMLPARVCVSGLAQAAEC